MTESRRGAATLGLQTSGFVTANGPKLGAALMAHALVPCDRDQKLAYLDSTNPKNIPLYERHGFELLGTIQVGSSPPVFPMLRKPR